MSEISLRERAIWYKSALTTLKQSVLQRGDMKGTNPERVVQQLGGDDFDAWIPRIPDGVRFDAELWQAAESILEYSTDKVETLEVHMLRYWHNYEALVRGRETTLTGGKPDPERYRRQLQRAWRDAVRAIKPPLTNKPEKI